MSANDPRFQASPWVTFRHGVRFCAVAALAWLGSAQASGPLADLPAPVAAAVARSVDEASRDPTVLLAEARFAASSSGSFQPRPSWDLSADLRRGRAGGTALDANASLSFALLEPSSLRERAEHEAQEATLRLERSLLRRDAALETLTTWLSVWASRQRLALLDLATDAIGSDPNVERRRQAWLSQRPALELEARLWSERLAAQTPSGAGPPDRDAWRAWAMGDLPRGCPDREPEVLLARAELARVARTLQASRLAASTPSLSVGASLHVGAELEASLGTPASGNASPQLGGRVWLNLGAPASWSSVGSLRLQADPDGTSLGVQLGSEATTFPGPFELEQEVAQARLDTAIRDARERTAFARASLATLVARLGTVSPPTAIRHGVRFDRLEEALDEVDMLVRAVEGRARLRIDCTPDR